MPEYISEKLQMKKVLERWENEGGKLSVEQTEMPEDNSSGKRRKEKYSSRILRSDAESYRTPSN